MSKVHRLLRIRNIENIMKKSKDQREKNIGNTDKPNYERERKREIKSKKESERRRERERNKE